MVERETFENRGVNEIVTKVLREGEIVEDFITQDRSIRIKRIIHNNYQYTVFQCMGNVIYAIRVDTKTNIERLV